VRFAIVFLAAFAGCVATLPNDASITADLACETARAVVQMRAAVPTPDDKPKPGDKCPNCEGRGYVGDGTVRVKCSPCDGTGRVK
jgi:DnaJ-class molecular chaperone